MEMTMSEYYDKIFTNYYMMFDNKGKFKEGKGICPYTVVKKAEEIMKKGLTNRRKTDVYARVLYSNEQKDVARIYLITKGEYNKTKVRW